MRLIRKIFHKNRYNQKEKKSSELLEMSRTSCRLLLEMVHVNQNQ